MWCVLELICIESFAALSVSVLCHNNRLRCKRVCGILQSLMRMCVVKSFTMVVMFALQCSLKKNSSVVRGVSVVVNVLCSFTVPLAL